MGNELKMKPEYLHPPSLPIPPLSGPFGASNPFQIIRTVLLIVVGFVTFFVGLSIGLIIGILFG